MRINLKAAAIIAFFGLLLFVFVSPFISGRRRMTAFRTRIQPGMSVDELLRFAGKPRAILHRGEPLRTARRSFTLPPLDEHTAVYCYPKDGVPYFCVYVFIDERRNAVSSCTIDNLWW